MAEQPRLQLLSCLGKLAKSYLHALSRILHPCPLHRLLRGDCAGGWVRETSSPRGMRRQHKTKDLAADGRDRC